MLWIAIVAISLHFILHKLAKHFLRGRFAPLPTQTEQNLAGEFALKLTKRVSYALQGVVVTIQAKLWLEQGTTFLHFLEVMTDQSIILFALLSLFTVLDIFQAVSDRSSSQAHFPLKGLLQTVKLIGSILTAILAVSLLMDKSPLILLSGLGALSAVLLLVFKDPLLGLVAGIQLSANNMLAVGDWLEMPKYGAAAPPPPKIVSPNLSCGIKAYPKVSANI